MDEGDFAEGWTEARGKLAAELVGAVEHSVQAGAQSARTTHRYTDRTGDATASIDSGVTSVHNGGADGIVECSVPYGRYLADGTKPHDIDPIDPERPLRFQVGGRWVSTYHVSHPGTKPDPFMDNALEAADAALGTDIDAAIDAAFASAGFDR